MLRQSRRPALVVRRGDFMPLPLVGAAPTPSTGFICQDFSGTTFIESYGGTLTVAAYAGTVAIDAFSGSITVDSYGGAAANCGR